MDERAASIPKISLTSSTWLVVVLVPTIPSVFITSFKPYPSTKSSFLLSSLMLITARKIFGRPLIQISGSTRLSSCIRKKRLLRWSSPLFKLSVFDSVTRHATKIRSLPMTETSLCEIFNFGALQIASAMLLISNSNCNFSIESKSTLIDKKAKLSLYTSSI